MMHLPTIFEWLEQVDFLRGLPAVYLVLATAVVIVVAWDWRLAIAALAGQYMAIGLLFADVLEARLAAVKLLVGLFVCLILYMTARQVNWGRLPEDITPAEAAQLGRRRYIGGGPLSLPASVLSRFFLVLLVLLVVFVIGQRPAYRLPGMAEALDYLNLAVYGLVGIGLVGMGLSSEPFKAGMGILMFLSGVELFYSSLEQSAAMLAALAAAHFVVALAIAYLTQTKHAFPTILD